MHDFDLFNGNVDLLSKLHWAYSNNRLVINEDMSHKSLFQRELTCYCDLCALRNIV